MGDAHVVIVHHHGQHVSRGAVRAQQHEIVEFGIGDSYIALHQIGQGNLAFARGLDAHHEGLAHGVGCGIGIAPFAFDAERAALGLCRLTAGGQFLWRQIAAISLAGCQQLRGHLGMPAGPGKLEHRRFIAGKAQPIQTVENRLDRGLCGAGAVCVLDSQQVLAAVVSCKQVIEQGGARAANVQIAGGRGCETGDDRASGSRLSSRCASACHSLVLPVH